MTTSTRLAFVLGLLATGCSLFAAGPSTMNIESADIREGAAIPAKFTCTGADVSPGLRWGGAPAKTHSFAIIVEDPDAPGGSWVHWVIYNVPAIVHELPEHVPTTEMLASGAVQGRNDFKKVGYAGPCPPAGKPHRYLFRVYALDTKLPARAGMTKAELERAMSGHIVATGQLTAHFGRR